MTKECQIEYDPFYGLACALLPAGLEGRSIAVLTGYFDDSGTHEGSLNVTVGGFVAEVDQWRRLSDDWSELLEDYNLAVHPGYFHMADFESKENTMYGPWESGRRIEFMKRLTGIIKNRVSIGVAASFPKQHLDLMKSGTEYTFPKGYEYMTCAQVCWKNIGDWSREGNRNMQPVATVFANGSIGNGLVLQAHRDMGNSLELATEFRLGGIGFEFMKRCKPLQAADFFAYETYRRMNANLANREAFRKSVDAIVSTVPVYANYLDDESARCIVDFLNRNNVVTGGIL